MADPESMPDVANRVIQVLAHRALTNRTRLDFNLTVAELWLLRLACQIAAHDPGLSEQYRDLMTELGHKCQNSVFVIDPILTPLGELDWDRPEPPKEN